MFTGTVKWFNYSKGYGFVKQDNGSQDIFLHISTLEKSNIPNISEGQKISYQVAPNKGKDSAVDIKLI